MYGDRLAILVNGGGISTLATDTLSREGGQLVRLALATLERLSQVLPPNGSHDNPVDVLDDAPGSRYAAALEILLQVLWLTSRRESLSHFTGPPREASLSESD